MQIKFWSSGHSFTLSDERYNDVMPAGLLIYRGGTVCDDSFNDNAANAICREMGYTRAVRWETFGDQYEIQNQLVITLDDVSCPDGNWESCYYRDDVNNCNHNEDVYLHCQGTVGFLIQFINLSSITSIHCNPLARKLCSIRGCNRL